MATFEIPLTPAAQTFLISLAGVQYQMALQWRDAVNNGGWVLDIADETGNALVSGIPLVTGVDLLAEYKYIGIDAELWVQTDAADVVPTYTNLGIQSHLYAVV